MYKRNAQGWSRHFDFMLVDVISLLLAFILAVYIRSHLWAFNFPIYRFLAMSLILSDFAVIALNNSLHDVVKRSLYVEAVQTFKHAFLVFALIIIYTFATQTGDNYSRIILFLCFGFHMVFGFITRILWKILIRNVDMRLGARRSVLVVVTLATAEDILKRLSGDKFADYKIVGVVVVDPYEEETICGFPVVANLDTAADYIVREWVDSVYIDAPLNNEKVLNLMDDCAVMAVPTHYHVPNMSRSGVKRFSEKMGGTTVLTSSINYATPLQAFVKRLFDIFAGLVGSIMALLIMAIVGPIIKKQSPGPILFSQERVGQNGKHFKMYKIRSMRLDAEEHKKELMEQNRVKDGMMFKLDFDPRIIGNEILPDGTKKTGIGEFIRKTSLDEFPQFFCVLTGVMSTVGTRPPTLDEYKKYKYHHRARMSVKPGVTGMWQASGRSEITDFEEVVRLDTEYISNWSLSLDFKLILKTIWVVLRHKGAM